MAGFFIHMGELSSDEPVTSHLDIFEALAEDEDAPIHEFLYYDVKTDS